MRPLRPNGPHEYATIYFSTSVPRWCFPAMLTTRHLFIIISFQKRTASVHVGQSSTRAPSRLRRPHKPRRLGLDPRLARRR